MGNCISERISVRLDFLRGLAAQAVLIEHILTTSGMNGVFIGSFGVVVFFILSGFLIHITTISAYEKGQFSIPYFISKRFFRIFTLYIPLIILCFGIDIIIQYFGLPQPEKVIQNYTVQNLIGSFFMLQQNVFSEFASQIFDMEFLNIKPYGSARPFWTVAIEWWIYLAYGFLFSFFIAKKKIPKVFSVYGMLFGFSLIVVVFNSISGIGHNLTFVWLIGAVVGHYYYRFDFTKLTVNNKYLLVLMVGLFLMFLGRIAHMKLSPMYVNAIPYDMVNVIIFTLFFICFLLLSSACIDRGWLSKFSRYIGEISYSLYLIHFTILSALYGMGMFDKFDAFTFLVSFVVSNFLAVVLYYSIDRFHSLLWMRYWELRVARAQ